MDCLDGVCNISCKARCWPSRAQHSDHRGSNERIGIRRKILFGHGTRAWSRYLVSAKQSPRPRWKRLLFAFQIGDRACLYEGSPHMVRCRSWIVGRTIERIKGRKWCEAFTWIGWISLPACFGGCLSFSFSSSVRVLYFWLIHCSFSEMESFGVGWYVQTGNAGNSFLLTASFPWNRNFPMSSVVHTCDLAQDRIPGSSPPL